MPATSYNRTAGVSLQFAGGLPPKRGSRPTPTPGPIQDEPEAAQAEAISFRRTARDSGLGQINYQATTLTVERIQAALRAAERGQTWLFFSIVRDMIGSFTHLQSEWNKRKMVIVGQPMSLIPATDSESDKVSCSVIQEAIDNCRNWQDGLQHLLDATLMPISVAEKIWEPIGMSDARNFKYLKRFRLKELAPVNYTLFDFSAPYRGNMRNVTGNPAQNFNPDDWEAWLKFHDTEPNGNIDYGISQVYAPDPAKHIIHRGNLLSTTIPPNWGGHIRAILFYWLLITQDRDWWALMMAKYGMPIPVAKVNDNNKQTMSDMRNALALGMQLGGIAIPKGATLEWSGAVGTDGSNAHKIFSDDCRCEVSKIVVGQVTSARPEKGGLAGGMAEQAEAVRDDVRMWDVLKLSDTARYQLFRQILDLNGYFAPTYGVPRAFWGGMSGADFIAFSKGVAGMYQAGVRLSPAGIISASERAGISFEQIPPEILNPPTGGDKGFGKPGGSK